MTLRLKKLLDFIKDFCIEKIYQAFILIFLMKSELEFLEKENFLIRYGEQFHFINNKYNNFENFLDTLSYKNRKKIIKERESIIKQGINIEVIKAENIKESM